MRRFDCIHYEECLTAAAGKGLYAGAFQGKRLGRQKGDFCTGCESFEEKKPIEEPDPFVTELNMEEPKKCGARYQGQACSVEGCEEAAKSSGMCKKHYAAWYYRENREKHAAEKREQYHKRATARIAAKEETLRDLAELPDGYVSVEFEKKQEQSGPVPGGDDCGDL